MPGIITTEVSSANTQARKCRRLVALKVRFFVILLPLERGAGPRDECLTKIVLRNCTNSMSCADYFERAIVGWAGKIHIIIPNHV